MKVSEFQFIPANGKITSNFIASNIAQLQPLLRRIRMGLVQPEKSSRPVRLRFDERSAPELAKLESIVAGHSAACGPRLAVLRAGGSVQWQSRRTTVRTGMHLRRGRLLQWMECGASGTTD